MEKSIVIKNTEITFSIWDLGGKLNHTIIIIGNTSYIYKKRLID